MKPSPENNDQSQIEHDFADRVGRVISYTMKLPGLEFTEGEVVIFLGFTDRKGLKKTKYFFGSQVNSTFKGKVFETAMDIILSDPNIGLPGEILDTNETIE